MSSMLRKSKTKQKSGCMRKVCTVVVDDDMVTLMCRCCANVVVAVVVVTAAAAVKEANASAATCLACPLRTIIILIRIACSVLHARQQDGMHHFLVSLTQAVFVSAPCCPDRNERSRVFLAAAVFYESICTHNAVANCCFSSFPSL